MSTEKEKTKACCSKENEALKEHLEYCDSPSKTEEQKASLLSPCGLAQRSSREEMCDRILIAPG